MLRPTWWREGHSRAQDGLAGRLEASDLWRRLLGSSQKACVKIVAGHVLTYVLQRSV